MNENHEIMRETQSDEAIEKLIGPEPGPRKINKRVVRWLMVIAYMVAAISGILISAVSFAGGVGFNLLNLLAMALFFGLAYGVYRKSRICSVILVIYYIGLIMSQRAEIVPGVLRAFPIGFAVVYFLGMVGTIAIHAAENKRQEPCSGRP